MKNQTNPSTEPEPVAIADTAVPTPAETDLTAGQPPVSTTSQPAATPGPDIPAGDDPKAQLRQLLEEAEQRGYKRGLNEQLRKALDQPQMFSDLARDRHERNEPQTQPDGISSRFLRTVRPGIWD